MDPTEKSPFEKVEDVLSSTKLQEADQRKSISNLLDCEIPTMGAEVGGSVTGNFISCASVKDEIPTTSQGGDRSVVGSSRRCFSKGHIPGVETNPPATYLREYVYRAPRQKLMVQSQNFLPSSQDSHKSDVLARISSKINLESRQSSCARQENSREDFGGIYKKSFRKPEESEYAEESKYPESEYAEADTSQVLFGFVPAPVTQKPQGSKLSRNLVRLRKFFQRWGRTILGPSSSPAPNPPPTIAPARNFQIYNQTALWNDLQGPSFEISQSIRDFDPHPVITLLPPTSLAVPESEIDPDSIYI